jgi:hypothetical protein
MPAIPFIGPFLTWIVGPFWSVAKGLGTSAVGLAKVALANPAIVGALATAILFLGYNMEESGKRKIAADGDARVAVVRKAFDTERASFAKVDGALKGQNKAVAALSTAGRAKLTKSATMAATDAKALSRAALQSAMVLASGKGATACDRIADTDRAFLEQLK